MDLFIGLCRGCSDSAQEPDFRALDGVPTDRPPRGHWADDQPRLTSAAALRAWRAKVARKRTRRPGESATVEGARTEGLSLLSENTAMSALVPAHSSAEGELRTEVSRLQQTNASLQSDMIMKHVPLQDLHASRAEKYAADAALAKFAECVQSWAQRRGDAVPGQQLLAPATPEHVAALFEYVKSGSRKHLASASTPRHNKRTAEQAGLSASGGGGGASPFASPAVSPLVDGEQVAGLHAQLVELEGRLKAAQLEAVAHDEQLAAAAAEQQALRDRLTAKETEITQHAEAASASAAAATSSAAAAAKHSAEKAAAEQLAVAETQARESQALELAKAGAEQRADETAAKLAEAATTAEDIRTQTDRVRTQLSQELQVAQQAKSELLEQREPMQRALESAQAQAEQSERGKRELKAQLEERGAAHAQLTQRVEASEHDRAALKQRLEGTASKVDQLAAAATEQQALHDRLAAKETEIAQHVAAAAAAATRQQQEAADRTAAPAGMSTAAPEYLPHSEKSESQQTTQAVEDDEPVGTLTVTPASEMQERTTLEVSSASPAAAASSPAAPAPKRASSKRKSSAQPAEDNDYVTTQINPHHIMIPSGYV